MRKRPQRQNRENLVFRKKVKNGKRRKLRKYLGNAGLSENDKLEEMRRLHKLSCVHSYKALIWGQPIGRMFRKSGLTTFQVQLYNLLMKVHA